MICSNQDILRFDGNSTGDPITIDLRTNGLNTDGGSENTILKIYVSSMFNGAGNTIL